MKLPKITTKQQTILKLIYRYRFLNRVQIQALLGHKSHKNTIVWLKDLRQKQYLDWIYSTDFAEKTKPAIYYLNIDGLRYLTSTGDYPIEELRKRYREHSLKQPFIDRSILLADCCISLMVNSVAGVSYSFVTHADYTDPGDQYHFFAETGLIKPQLIIKKQERLPQTTKTTNYLLEVFDASLPQYRIRKRLKDYVKFLADGAWAGERDDPEPIILLVCPSLHVLIYAKWRVRKYLEDIPSAADIKIQFTTTEILKQRGMTAEIWEIL
ncbi:MAG: replication-relaxation family protein [Candidatus Saccharimonadales bacterium]